MYEYVVDGKLKIMDACMYVKHTMKEGIRYVASCRGDQLRQPSTPSRRLDEVPHIDLINIIFYCCLIHVKFWPLRCIALSTTWPALTIRL